MRNLPERPARWLAIASCIAAAWVVATTGFAVLTQFHPLPYYDDWAAVDDALAWTDGQLTLGRLFNQHNEHRVLFPRLVFLVDHVLGSGSGVLSQLAIAAAQIVNVVALVVLLAGRGLSRPRAILGGALVCVCMASSAHLTNLGWSVQLSVNGVYAAASVSMLAMHRAGSCERGSRAAWLAVAIAAALVATFTRANGMLTWPLLAAFAWACGLRRELLAVLVIGAAAIATYLVGYEQPPHHPSPAGSLSSRPVRVVRFALGYLGLPFRAYGVGAAIGFGAAGVFAAAVAIADALRRARTIARADLALRLLLLFPLGTASLTALGRMGAPPDVPSRYATPVLYFWSLLTAVVLGAATRRPVVVAATLLLGAVQVALLEQQLEGIRVMQPRLDDRRAAELSLLTGVYDEPLMQRVTLDRAHLVHAGARHIRDHGKSVFASPRAELVGARVSSRFEVGADRAGTFDGWRPADGVSAGVEVFGSVREDVGATLVVIAGADERIVGLAFPDGEGRWRGYARILELDRAELHAWAIARDRTAHALTGAHTPALEQDPRADSLGAQILRVQDEGPVRIGREVLAAAGAFTPLLGVDASTVVTIEPGTAADGGLEVVEPWIADLPAVRCSGWLPPSAQRTVVLIDGRQRVVGIAHETTDAATSERLAWRGLAMLIEVEHGALGALAIRADGTAIRLAPAPSREPTSFDTLDTPVECTVTPGGAWTSDGAVSDYVPPPLDDAEVFESWSGSDANLGTLEFGPITAHADADLGVPVLAGPSSAGLSLRVVDAATGRVLDELGDWHAFQGRWRVWRVAVRGEVVVVADDRGAEWGQWLATAAPYWITPGRR